MKKTVILILILNLYVFSQEKIIVKIGNDVITQKDFEFKYETTFKYFFVVACIFSASFFSDQVYVR